MQLLVASRSQPGRAASPFNSWSARPATLNSVTVSTTSPVTMAQRASSTTTQRVIIEDKNEVAAVRQRDGDIECALRADPLAQSRAAPAPNSSSMARSAAISAAFAGCPISPARHAGRSPMPHPASLTVSLHLYLGSRSSSSMEMPCGPRRKQILIPGRGMVGSVVNSTPFFFRSATMASMPVTARPKWSRP